MKILSYREFQPHQRITFFRQGLFSHILGLLTIVAMFGLAAFVMQKEDRNDGVWLYLVVFFLLFAYLFSRGLHKALSPTSWVVAVDDQGFWIKFRSYYNPHLSIDDLQIAFFTPSEVSNVQLLKSKEYRPSLSDSETILSFAKYLDFEIAPNDLATLGEAIDSESRARVVKKTFFGTTSSRAMGGVAQIMGQHVRVNISDIRPSRKKLMELFERRGISVIEKSVTLDFRDQSTNQNRAG